MFSSSSFFLTSSCPLRCQSTSCICKCLISISCLLFSRSTLCTVCLFFHCLCWASLAQTFLWRWIISVWSQFQVVATSFEFQLGCHSKHSCQPTDWLKTWDSSQSVRTEEVFREFRAKCHQEPQACSVVIEEHIWDNNDLDDRVSTDMRLCKLLCVSVRLLTGLNLIFCSEAGAG